MSVERELPVEIDVAEVSKLRESSEDFLLLDVRETDEYAIAKIEGSTLLPMSELGNRIEELEAHREKRIVVYCHHGGRSLQVTQALRRHGFSQVQNMTGGIDLWSQQIDSDVARY